jgi:hypothetical protein
MDNDLSELEAELKRLRPVAVSVSLTSEVNRKLDGTRHTFWAWAALPLAAALVGVVLLKDKAVGPPVAPTLAPALIVTTYKPVSAENLLYDSRDEGLVTLADGTTARRYRRSYVDTITWKNHGTQASLRWSVPRTEERVVPVTFQ